MGMKEDRLRAYSLGFSIPSSEISGGHLMQNGMATGTI